MQDTLALLNVLGEGTVGWAAVGRPSVAGCEHENCDLPDIVFDVTVVRDDVGR